MGSGLSLTDYQLTEIVRRDLCNEYRCFLANRGMCKSQKKLCENYLEDEQYYLALREVNNILERIQSQRAKICTR